MEFKVVFSMDKKTIECIDRLAGALAGIKNLSLPEADPEVTKQEKAEPIDTPQETIPDTKEATQSEQTEQPETATRVYTRDELSKAAAEFARSGADKREQLQNLVKEKFGVTGLMNIPEERYGEFAADLREMGANI